MITIIYSLLSESVNVSAQIGAWITLACDVVISLIYLYKACKSGNLTPDALIAWIRSIRNRFTKKNKEDTDNVVQQNDSEHSDNLRK